MPIQNLIPILLETLNSSRDSACMKSSHALIRHPHHDFAFSNAWLSSDFLLGAIISCKMSLLLTKSDCAFQRLLAL